MYGLVDEATSPASAMATVLRIVQNTCNEKPQVGLLFKARGTNSVAVFFTVIDQSQGQTPLAGLLIAAPSGPHQFEAALVSDDAARFGSTVNPMLERLFDEWRPDGFAQVLRSPLAAQPPADKPSPPAPSVRTITLPDDTARVDLPDGWELDPGGGGGTMTVTGPHRERIGLNLCWLAVEPKSRPVREGWLKGGHATFFDRVIVYPYEVDPIKAFPDIFQQMRHTNGLRPTELHITHAEPATGIPGQRCVRVTGSLNPDGKGVCEMNTVMCATKPDQMGMYVLTLFHTLLPLAVAKQARATAAAIVASYRLNTALIRQTVAAKTGATYGAGGEGVVIPTRPQIDVQPMGAAVQAHIAAVEAAKVRNNQGLRKYILDLAFLEEHPSHGDGGDWNSTAAALVRADPKRYEFVDEPNYWRGTDYVP